MERITIVLQEGLGLNFEAMRPAMQSGAAVAIGRGGAVIAEIADGNAIEDKRKAAQSAGGLIDSVERYVENSEKLEGVVVGLESALICIESCAINGQSEPLAALRRIREITTAFLENSGGRAQQSTRASGAAAEPAKPGSEHVRRKFVPCEQPHPARASDCCRICSQPDHVDENCPWQGARAGLALVQKIDQHIADRAAASEAPKPGIFDIITGTAGQSAPRRQDLPSPEEHAAQIERVAADLREHGPDLVLLKPCGFCGGPPVPFVQLASQGFGSAPRLDSYGDDGLSVEAFVYCHECGANGPMFAEDIFDASDYDQAMAEGVRLWQDRDNRNSDVYQANAADGQNIFPRPDLEVGDV
ncbi:hypothetical protein ACKI1H_07855 [Pseudomonas sp. YH-1]|uniref:hypothetical protein n=1 Tax=Pseudomonas sp. YH-1 TaxID=3384787 RepID=UPI003F7DF258